jgi:thioredoxin-like negative regulator of GroEL
VYKLSGDLAKLKQKYADKLNFVMLNVDNTKWLPEILHYRVDGIPHFVFLNSQGDTIAENIGEIPREIMSANLQSLIADLPLPYTQTNGQFSEFKAPVSPTKTSSDDPRSHGG